MAAISRSAIYFVVMSSVFNTDLPIHVKYDVKVGKSLVWESYVVMKGHCVFRVPPLGGL